MSEPDLNLDHFREIIARPGVAECYWIGYSGGLDSHVLLHLCARLRENDFRFRFHALHIHHGLHAQADTWNIHCLRVCENLHIPLHSLRVQPQIKSGDSPEESARTARYHAFSQALSDNHVLLLAHHRNDQAETILLQLLRGAGLAGLSGMPEKAAFARGHILRPLLDLSRNAILDYARHHSLHWIEDPSNQDRSYDRNYLRHQVMPIVAARWPEFGKTLRRSGHHCAEAQELLEQIADADYQTLKHPQHDTLSIKGLSQLETKRQRLVLRHWIRRSGYRMPAAVVLERVLRELLPAKADANPRVHWSAAEFRRYRNELYLLPPLATIDTTRTDPWDGHQRFQLGPECGFIEARSSSDVGISSQAWQSGKITIGFRQGGEHCHIEGIGEERCLKRLLQKHAVPPWVRERMPLIYIDGTLAAIADLWVCSDFYTVGEAIKLHWAEHHLGWHQAD